jgi:hypothetical protein
VAALDGSGLLLLRTAPSVLDLYEVGMGGNLPFDVGLDLALIAGCVEALVALHVANRDVLDPLRRGQVVHGPAVGLRV